MLNVRKTKKKDQRKDKEKKQTLMWEETQEGSPCVNMETKSREKFNKEKMINCVLASKRLSNTRTDNSSRSELENLKREYT